MNKNVERIMTTVISSLFIDAISMTVDWKCQNGRRSVRIFFTAHNNAERCSAHRWNRMMQVGIIKTILVYSCVVSHWTWQKTVTPWSKVVAYILVCLLFICRGTSWRDDSLKGLPWWAWSSADFIDLCLTPSDFHVCVVFRKTNWIRCKSAQYDTLLS